MKYILISLLFFSALYAEDISGLLPASAGSCYKSGDAQLYKGNELFRLIDGGAVIFHEYGFNQVIVQRYIDADSSSIDIEIYEMNDSSAAFGIFSLFTFETGLKSNFSSNAYAGDDFLIFCKGNYYITITATAPSKRTIQSILAIAKAVEIRIAAANKPSIADMFDKVDDRIVYMKGNFALYNLSNINFRSSLQVNEGICFEKDGNNYFILKYDSRESASQNVNSAGEFLQKEQTYLKEETTEGLSYFKENQYVTFLQSGNYLVLVVSDKKKVDNSTISEIKNVLVSPSTHPPG